MEDGKKRVDRGPFKFLVTFLLIAVLAYVYFDFQKSEGVGVNDTAPSFSLPSRGGVVGLDQFQGQVVLINFWATWCPPCVEEMPTLEVLKTRLEGRDFQILAINLDEGGWSSVERFLERVPLTVTILVDPQGQIAALYETDFLPQSVLVDKKGTIVKKYLGPRDWTGDEVVSEILRYVESP